jgi:hypothetical protein
MAQRGPGFEGVGENSAESSYYTLVDQHNTSGLSENIPMSTANLGDGFVALKDGKMITIGFPIRSASIPRASMGGSTIRTAAGKAADCGARTATARPGSRKVARAQCRAPCTSSFGPIRWRTEVRRDNLNARGARLRCVRAMTTSGGLF